MAEDMVLAPPEALEAPKPVAVVPKEKATGMVPLDDQTKAVLDAKAGEFVEIVLSSEVHSAPFEEKITAIHNMGNKEIRAAANVSNRMLERPMNAMEGAVFDGNSPISRSLLDLRTTVEDLNPANQGDLLAPSNLQKIPIVGKMFVSPIRQYFMKYQSAQKQIDQILNNLYEGQDTLQKDTAAIEQEKVVLWETMQKLQKYIYVGKQIDAAIEARVAELEVSSPEKARVVKEELLFYVRQKVQDLLTQLAVSIQGYLALDMVRKNNLELIKGVDRATTTTISALRTAVIVAQALANQKLVLDQINALNTTTSNVIESTSAMLKQQSAEIHEQAASATVSIEKLQTAFNNIYDTLDMIDEYKLSALDNMKETVNTLSGEIDRAQTYMDRARGEITAGATANIGVLTPSEEESGANDFGI